MGIRKFPKDLIDDMKTKFAFLQRKPKTAEQRKEQDKECHSRRRSAESEIDKEMRLNKQKEYNEKRFAESEIERQRRLNKQKQYDNEKRSAESDIEKKRRLNKQKEYENEKRSA